MNVIPHLEHLIPVTGARSKPCRHCPSAGGRTDHEVDEILTWPRDKQMETLFTCAWTPGKLCRGYCDTLKATEADIDMHKGQP
jgi:hypothetical protein